MTDICVLCDRTKNLKQISGITPNLKAFNIKVCKQCLKSLPGTDEQIAKEFGHFLEEKIQFTEPHLGS